MLNRREFLRRTSGNAVGIVTAPYIVSSCNIFPSQQITLGMIGVGIHGLEFDETYDLAGKTKLPLEDILII